MRFKPWIEEVPSQRLDSGSCSQGGITQDEYDKTARELKERQSEITARIGQPQRGEEGFDLMVNRRGYATWLALLDTVRTERFEQVLALRPTLSHLTLAA